MRSALLLREAPTAYKPKFLMTFSGMRGVFGLLHAQPLPQAARSRACFRVTESKELRFLVSLMRHLITGWDSSKQSCFYNISQHPLHKGMDLRMALNLGNFAGK
jgi:hypothetical protein